MQPYEEDDSEIVIPINNDLDQRIHDTFMAHDSSGNKTADAESLGIIIRALGMFPSNEEVNEIVQKTQKKNQKGVVHLVSFLPFIADEITKGKYKPKTVEEVLEAFRVLDPENYGYLTSEQMRAFMTEHGEPLDEEEMAEMLEVAYNPFTKKIHFEGFVNKLIYEPKGEDDIYTLAKRVEAEKPAPVVETKRRFSQMFSSRGDLVRTASRVE
ncbi:hypothetical protein HHI36_021262 [Cryptolaemus montrouzieri]|uniref:EF-hand domain-containing protein n=1 Tax=Cryptolaemus montrouzieri TaxID=559131 RepID=A0ABD2MWQ1_9CUCU